jgi:uncharacterized membrane protein
MLLAGIAIGAVRLWRRENKEDEAFIRLLIVSGAALAWAVEFFYIRDFFGTRMNTVFKLYYQVWVLWSLALAWAMGALWERSDRARPAFALGFAATIALAVLYPILMIPIKAEFFLRLPTLDGYAHLARSAPDDLAAIEWLNAHVRSTPVILEAPGWGGISFQPEIGRFSAHTGLPTVLGWGGHEHQWRGSYAEMARREPDLRILWQSPDLEQTLELLEKYEIVYVIVGQTERRLFSPSVLRKFELLMDPVFRSGETVIYRRRERRTCCAVARTVGSSSGFSGWRWSRGHGTSARGQRRRGRQLRRGQPGEAESCPPEAVRGSPDGARWSSPSSDPMKAGCALGAPWPVPLPSWPCGPFYILSGAQPRSEQRSFGPFPPPP